MLKDTVARIPETVQVEGLKEVDGLKYCKLGYNSVLDCQGMFEGFSGHDGPTIHFNISYYPHINFEAMYKEAAIKTPDIIAIGVSGHDNYTIGIMPTTSEGFVPKPFVTVSANSMFENATLGDLGTAAEKPITINMLSMNFALFATYDNMFANIANIDTYADSFKFNTSILKPSPRDIFGIMRPKNLKYVIRSISASTGKVQGIITN